MLQVKSLFLGSEKVGKTSIIKQYCMGSFSDSYTPTDNVTLMVRGSNHPAMSGALSGGIRHNIWDSVRGV